MRVDHVASHTIWGSDVVLGLEVRQGPPEIIKESLVLIRDRDTRRASFPHAHEPNRIKTVCGNRVPFRCRYGGQVNFPPILLLDVIQPYPRVYLIGCWIWEPVRNFCLRFNSFKKGGIHGDSSLIARGTSQWMLRESPIDPVTA